MPLKKAMIVPIPLVIIVPMPLSLLVPMPLSLAKMLDAIAKIETIINKTLIFIIIFSPGILRLTSC